MGSRKGMGRLKTHYNYVEFHYLLTLNEVLFTVFAVDLYNKKRLTISIKSDIVGKTIYGLSKGDTVAYWHLPECATVRFSYSSANFTLCNQGT